MAFDLYLFNLINGFAGQSKLLDLIGIFFAKYLAYILIIAALVIIFYEKNWRKRLYDFSLVAISLLLSRGLITQTIRFFYHRPRPYIESPEILTLIDRTGEASFPSGHATFFFALAVAIYFVRPKWFYYFLAGAIVMGIARIFVGVHYPLDILGGAIIGWAMVYVVKKYFLKNLT